MAEKIRRVFTNRDYGSFRTFLLNHLQSKYSTVFNDLRESHFAVMAVEMVCKLADEMMFYLDHQYNEALIDTVGERRNIRSIVKLIDYRMRNRTAAIVTLSCICDEYSPNTLTILEDTVIQTGVEGISFRVLKEYSFNGDRVFTIEAIEGDVREDLFTATGQTSQEYITMFDSVVDNEEVKVYIDSILWTEVDSFTEVEIGDYYERDNTEDLRVKILFGDGTHGNVPSSGAEVKIQYGTGSGLEGNIGTGKITTSIQGTLSGPPNTLDVAIVNNSPASGGGEEETVDEARVNAPLSLKATKGLVSKSDYKGFCLAYPGVLAVSISIDPFMNIVVAYIVAANYSIPGVSLLNSLKAAILVEASLGLLIDVRAPVFVYVNVSGVVIVEDTSSLADVTNTVNAAIKEFFEPVDPIISDKDFGQDIFISDIVSLVASQYGVNHVNVEKLAMAPVVTTVNWHSTTAQFSNVSLGLTARQEMWTVKFISSSSFQMIGSVSGLQQNVGSVDIPYITDDGSLSFTVIQGIDPLEAGDYALVKTSSYVGNVKISSEEFVLQGAVAFIFEYKDLGV